MSNTEHGGGSLAVALAAFQAEVPAVAKGKTGDAGSYKYQYADLSDVTEKVLPLLGKHGLSFSAKPTVNDRGALVLAYTLRHVSGESDGGEYPLSGGNAQQLGSAITYARRYSLCAVTGVAPGGDDDDGSSAKDVRVEAHQREPQWDPNEQESLRDAYLLDIAKAKTKAEVQKIGGSVKAQRQAGELSPSTYGRLAKAASERLAELDAEAARAAAPVPDNTDPA